MDGARYRGSSDTELPAGSSITPPSLQPCSHERRAASSCAGGRRLQQHSADGRSNLRYPRSLSASFKPAALAHAHCFLQGLYCLLGESSHLPSFLLVSQAARKSHPVVHKMNTSLHAVAL